MHCKPKIFKAFHMLEDKLLNSTFTFVAQTSISTLVVPTSRDIYLFCTRPAGHAVYESWYKQVSRMNAPHVLCNNSNVDIICKLLLKHYKQHVLAVEF